MRSVRKWNPIRNLSRSISNWLCCGHLLYIPFVLFVLLGLHISQSLQRTWFGHMRAEELDNGSQHEFFELSVEVLANVEHKLDHKTLEAIKDGESGKMCLRDISFACAVLSNLMYSSHSTSVQLREDCSSFFGRLGHYMVDLMDQACLTVEKTRSDVAYNCVVPGSFFGSRAILSSFKAFVCSPLFRNGRSKSTGGLALCTQIIQSFERLLKSVAEVFESSSEYGSDAQLRVGSSDGFDFKKSGDSCPSDGSSNLIVDMELDVSGSKDVDVLPLVLPSMTWGILCDLADKESNPRVRENLLFSM